MRASDHGDRVLVHTAETLVLETYQFGPGPILDAPPHAHDEYQFTRTFTDPVSYTYRGARHTVPVGSLTVLHPGEVHGARDLLPREAPATWFEMLYVPPDAIRALLHETLPRSDITPFVETPVLNDPQLNARFARLHQALRSQAPVMAVQDALLSAFVLLAERHGDLRLKTATPRVPHHVAHARTYLDAHFAEDVSLEQLAKIVQLSPYHLSRSFRHAFGLPPHAYLLQARVWRARRLLLDGASLAQAAEEVGFAHQSHFGRHFKRIVGVSPGRYNTKAQDRDSSAPYFSAIMADRGS